jgi:predicted transcriptional regulator
MNPIVEEMIDIYNDNELMHYGMPRRSGRYPWGSGDDPGQHGSGDFITRVEELRKKGITYKDEKTGKVYTGDTAIAKSLGLTTTQFRTELSIANGERRMYNVATAKSLTKDGLSPTDIGKKMGVNESTVRSWLNEKSEERMNEATKTAEFLKKHVDEKEMIDVGKGMSLELNVSPEKMKQALYMLEREGYHVYENRIPQATNPGKWTTQSVLCKPEIEYKEIYQLDRIKTINEYTSHDNGETFDKMVYPKSMDMSRLKILYKDDVGTDGFTGKQKDGTIELRRGVADHDLGPGKRYSQVRILVGDKYYLKGMAVYSDNMPDGVDVVFNSSKTKDMPLGKVLKEAKTDDPVNPFGSLIKPKGQSYYEDENGVKQLSLINKTRDEGDWEDWANSVPSQFLGKQSLSMAKKQLKLAKEDKFAEYDDICAINNPTIKKHLLEEFANNCDAAAVNLKAAALPGQQYHAIFPVNTLKDTEVYAPNYETGTKLALIRYPHAGLFEIPILTVNNKHEPAQKLLGNDVPDAIGINFKVAEQLSGADFDGDTVMCIPTHDPAGKVKVASRSPLKDLKDFDHRAMYPERPGMRYMTKKSMQTEMGVISNLITDMTLGGANDDELARAVKHSMVVVDAYKHKLDYKKSEMENNIAALKKEYQTKENGKAGGAATLLSRAKSQEQVVKRQGTPSINIKGKPGYDPTKPQGALIYKKADDAEYTVTKINKRTGEVTTKTEIRKQTSTKMAETDDANTLVSKYKWPMELVYADYANSMKDLANKARVEMVNTGKIEYSSSAKAAYQKEVYSLNEKLKSSLLNTVRERAAQRKTAYEVKEWMDNNPDADKGEIKKKKQQFISANRSEMGSVSRRKRNIDITDREWEAIQAGAISENKLKQILNNTDVDKLRERATPRSSTTLTATKINKIKNLNASNYTLAQIAAMTGVSTSTVSKYLKGEK